MCHLKRVAELRVIVRQRVEAVRALGENFSGTVLLEGRVVGLGQFLKQKLVAQPPRGVAGATFVWAEHGEVDAGLDQQLGDGAGDFLCAAIKRPRAADPPQHLEAGVVAGQRHVKTVGPRQPIRLREAPRVALGLHLAHGVGGGTGQRPLSGAVPAKIEQQAKRVDPHRAGGHAGVAQGARPDRLSLNHSPVHRRRLAKRRGFHQRLHVLHDALGRERFAGGISRAGLLAAAALHAGVEAQQLLPVEVRYFRDTDHAGFLDLLDRDRLQLAKRWRGQKQVHRPGDEMQQPREWDHRKKSETHRGMNPPHGQVSGTARLLTHAAEKLGYTGAHRRTPQRQPLRFVPHDAQSLHEVAGHANGKKQVERRPVARPMTNAVRPPQPPPREQANPDNEQQAEHIQRRLVNDVVPAVMKTKPLRELGRQMVDLQQRRAEKQHHEPGKHHDVRPTGKASTAHPLLSETLLEKSAEARFQPLKIAGQNLAKRDRSALLPKFPATPHSPDKNQHRHHGHDVKRHHRRRRDIAKCLACYFHRVVHHAFTLSDFGS